MHALLGQDTMTTAHRLEYKRRWDANKRVELRMKLEAWQIEVHKCPSCQRPLLLSYGYGRREKNCPRTWGFLSKKKPCVGFRLEWS